MYQKIITELAKSKTTLVAVSKTRSNEDIIAMYEQGQRIFGENRVQELRDKHESLPNDIEWHMIGNLQKNKVKYIAAFVHMIHSVDSIALLDVIQKEAKKNERKINILIQVKVATEESKGGFHKDTIVETIAELNFDDYPNIIFAGVMGMASFVDDQEQIQSEFKALKRCFDLLKTDKFSGRDDYKEISMGMSGDYQLAIEEGSTMVRIGSLLFG